MAESTFADSVQTNARLLVTPAIIVTLGFALHRYVNNFLDSDQAIFQDERALGWDRNLRPQLEQHLSLTLWSTVFVVIVAVPLGIFLTRPKYRRLGGPVLAGTSREPIWPTGLVGSISHVAGVGVALVAPAELSDGIGIDIESQRWAPELEDQVPRPEEREWLDAGSTTERSAKLLALFSAKESVFKAFYPSVGRYFGFAAASLVPTSSGFAASLVEEIDDRYPATRSFNISCQWFGTTVMTWLVLPKTP